MTETETPIPSPLELATAARVACTLLEEEIADLIRRPSPLRAQRLTDRARQTWQRIDALAARIEEQQAEIERLQIERSPVVQVSVVDAPLPESDLSDKSDLSDAKLRPLPPGQRPPGFEAVRARIRRSGRRTDAIDRIKAARGEGEPAPRRPRAHCREWHVAEKVESPWQRFVKAVEEKRLPIDQPIGVGEISRIAELGSSQLQNVQADLVIEGAPYRIRRDSGRIATIIRA